MAGIGCRVLAVAALTCASVAVSPAADAHVTVTPDTASKGGQTTLSFRVPNEREESETTRVELDFPDDHPVGRASVEVKPGWSYEIVHGEAAAASSPEPPSSDPTPSPSASMKSMNMASMDMKNMGMGNPATANPSASPSASAAASDPVVQRIIWTVRDESAAIPPGGYDLFNVRVGPLPTDVDVLHFKALQTYSNGEIVRWTDIAAAGTQEAAHPAPMLRLTNPTEPTAAPSATPMAGMAGMVGMAGMSARPEPSDSTTDAMAMDMSAMKMSANRDDSVNLALAMSVAGLFAGLVGVTLGVTTVRRTRRGGGS